MSQYIYNPTNPDLKVKITDFTLPPENIDGAPGSATIQVSNLVPDTRAQGALQVFLYISADDRLDARDQLVGFVSEGVSITNENPATFEFNYDNVVVSAPGSYNLIAEIVPGRTIDDANPDNNITAELVSTPGTNVANDWGSTFLNVVQDVTLVPDAGPTFMARNSAIVSSSMYETYNAFTGEFDSIPIFAEVVENIGDPPEGASLEAAIAGAAFASIEGLYSFDPDTRPTIEAQLEVTRHELLARGVSEEAFHLGLEFGKQIGAALVADRADDGAAESQDTPVPAAQVPLDSPEFVWRPTEKGVPPLTPGFGGVDPFVVPPEPFDVRPFPDPTSPEFLVDVQTVRGLGAASDTERTTVLRNEDQTDTAFFWLYDTEDTYTAPGHLYQVALENAALRDFDLRDTVRLLASTGLVLGDAAIFSRFIKFDFDRETGTTGDMLQPRPETVINFIAGPGVVDVTARDPEWEPLTFSPPFPDFISGHATFAGATEAVFAAYFGENTPLIVSSQERPGAQLFQPKDVLSDDNAFSRVYAGVHVPSSTIIGEEAGTELAEASLAQQPFAPNKALIDLNLFDNTFS